MTRENGSSGEYRSEVVDEVSTSGNLGWTRARRPHAPAFAMYICTRTRGSGYQIHVRPPVSHPITSPLSRPKDPGERGFEEHDDDNVDTYRAAPSSPSEGGG